MSDFDDSQSSFTSDSTGDSGGGDGPPSPPSDDPPQSSFPDDDGGDSGESVPPLVPPSSDLVPEKPKRTLDPDLPSSTFADEEPKVKNEELYDRGWLEIWRMALTSPKLETYQDILRERVQTLGRALTWLYISLVISTVAGGATQILFSGNQFSFGNNNNNVEPLFDTRLFGIIQIVGSPLWAALGLLIFLFFMGINHSIARFLLGGSGTYERLIFATASYYAPIGILSGLASFAGPIGGCGSALLGLYVLWLALVAMNAAHGFGWGKAFLATYIVPILLLCCMCFGLIFLIGAIADSSDTIFQDIIDSLVSPTPIGR